MSILRRLPIGALWWAALFVANVWGVSVEFAERSYGWVVFSAFAAGSAAFLCVQQWKGWKSGRDREAEEDCGDTGPDTGISAGSFYSNAITFSYGTGANLPARTREGARLAVEQADEPIRAWRAACIVLEGNRYRFASVIDGHGTYDAEAVAECRSAGPFGGYIITTWYGSATGRESKHEAPDEDCSCGFYAVADPADVQDLANGRGTVMIEADLYGRVIVHERGYRAQKQRALSVTIPADCLYCTAAAQPAVPADGGPLVFVCGEHIPDEHVLISSHDLAAKLGTEVRRSEAR